jgi:hypothetical protein
MSETIEALKRALASQTKPEVLIGRVKSFDRSKWVAEVEFNMGATVDDITVRSVINDNSTGLFIEPVVGSYVICVTIDGRMENMAIVSYSEIKSIEISPELKLILRSDAFGGLAKVESIQSNLDELKTAFDQMKTNIATALNAVGVGSGANGPGAASLFNSEMSSVIINFENMENENVKHG